MVVFFSLQENVKERETKQIVEKERLVSLHLIKLDKSRKTALTVQCKSNESRVFKQIEVKTINWKK